MQTAQSPIPTAGKTILQGPGPDPSDRHTIASRYSQVFIETCIFFAIIFFVFFLLDDQRRLFWTDSKLLWLPVFFLSVQHGLIGGLVATAFASAFFFLLEAPQRGAHQDFYDYFSIVALHPFQWLSYSVCIGGLRSLHIMKARDMETAFTDTVYLATEIGNGLERAVEEIERLELRIATDTATIGAVIKAFSEISYGSEREFLCGFFRFAMRAIGASTLAIYDNREEAPFFREDNLGEVNLGEAPILCPSLRTASRERTGKILRSDKYAENGFLPAGSVCAIWLKSANLGRGVYIVLVEQLEPNHSVAIACDRLFSLTFACERMLRLEMFNASRICGNT